MGRWGRVALCAALFGIGVFAALVLTAVDVTRFDDAGADVAELRALRASLGAGPPRWALDERGVPVRRAGTTAPATGRADALHIGFVPDSARSGALVRVDMPMWFLRLKGPALDLVLAHAEIDVPLRSADLIDERPGLLLDESLGRHGWLVVWLE